MKEKIKLLPIQQKILDDIVKNPNSRYTIFMPRKFGQKTFREQWLKLLPLKIKDL